VGVGFAVDAASGRSARKPSTPAEPLSLEAFLDGTRASSRNQPFDMFLPLCLTEERWAAGGEASWRALFAATEDVADRIAAAGGGGGGSGGGFRGGGRLPGGGHRGGFLGGLAAAAAAGADGSGAGFRFGGGAAAAPPPPARTHTRAVDVLCSLLNATVVAASDAQCTSASEAFAAGYLALARSLRALLRAFPATAGAHGAAKLRHFAASRDNRAKAHHPDLGELLPLLAAAPDAGALWAAGGLGEAVLEQACVRNVKWLLEDWHRLSPRGGIRELPPAARAAAVFAGTLKSRRVVAFQARFATLAAGIRFEDFADFAPPEPVLAALRRAHKQVQDAADWNDHRALLALPPLDAAGVDALLLFAVEESERLGYHTAGGGGGGGGRGGARGGGGGGGGRGGGGGYRGRGRGGPRGGW